jgi:hypothetical protein
MTCIDRYWRILLQKSKVASVRIFGETLKREAIDDSYNLSRFTEVPQISTRKPRLRPSEFLTPSAKRLLQQYRRKADLGRNANGSKVPRPLVGNDHYRRKRTRSGLFRSSLFFHLFDPQREARRSWVMEAMSRNGRHASESTRTSWRLDMNDSTRSSRPASHDLR